MALSNSFSLNCSQVWNHVEVKTIRSNHSTNSNPFTLKFEWFFSFCRSLGSHSDFNITGCYDGNACLVKTESNSGIRHVTSFSMNSYSDINPHSLSDSNRHPLVMMSKDACETLKTLDQSVIINFSCDKSHGLGQPLKLVSQACATTFNWPSRAACHGSKSSAYENEHPILTKCYLYDDMGRERNLRNLIHKDGHRVIVPPAVNSSTSSAESIFINICSEVNESCNSGRRSALGSSGTAACFKNGTKTDVLADVRKFSMRYDNVSDEVVVKYEESGNRSNCPEGFDTIIRLKCPSRVTSSYYALDSRQPFLISKDECEMVIEWETDYACPVERYTGNPTSCIVKGPDFQVDLSPLKKSALDFYLLKNVSTEDMFYTMNGADHHDIAFNICGGLSIQSNITNYCGSAEWKTTSVCRRAFNSTVGEVIGSMAGAQLTMADGSVVLTYPSMTVCPIDQTSHYKTIVTFVCADSDSEDPFFDMYDHCTHLITFKTKKACLPDHYQPLSCSVTDSKGVLYDLSPLRRNNNETLWRVDTAHYDEKNKTTMKEMYVNVCGTIPKVLKATSTCQGLSKETAACYFDPLTNSSTTLGELYEKPFFMADSLSLDYKNETEKVATLMTFKCHPGIFDSSPVLTNISFNGKTTVYQLEWETGAACPIQKNVGSDCQVFDENLGLLLDLNSLFQEHTDYMVSAGKYKYHLNFCGPVKGSPCQGDNVAICQEEVGQQRNWTIGVVNRNVSYFNGILSMSFENGTPYNNKEKTPRRADVVFICDDIGNDTSIQLVSEHDHTYTFRVFTSQACPHSQNIVPCLWQNGTHSVDLGKISVLEDDNHYHFIINRETLTSTMYYFNFCRPVNAIRLNRRFGYPCRPGSGVCRAFQPENKETQSMGVPSEPPLVTFDGNFSLLYKNGDYCSSDPKIRMTSKINFYCDENEGDGDVKLIRETTDGCGVEIDFVTSIVCEAFPHLKLPSKTKSSTTSFPSVVTPTPSSSTVTTTSSSKSPSSANKTNVIPDSPKLDNNTSGQVHPRDGYSVFGLLIVILIAFLSVSLAVIILINSETR